MIIKAYADSIVGKDRLVYVTVQECIYKVKVYRSIHNHSYKCTCTSMWVGICTNTLNNVCAYSSRLYITGMWLLLIMKQRD